MQKKRSIKIIAVVMILVLICVSITYFKNDSKVVLATTSEFYSENLRDNEHMHVEVDSDGDKVPVPNGYVGSKATGENEIDTGYVIYEGTEEVNDSNVEEAQKTRNQYVWIPVPDASTMYGIDENGKKWGKLYTFTTETGVGIDPVTGTKPLNWSESDGIMKILNKNDWREPDIVIEQENSENDSYDMDSILKKENIFNGTTHELFNKLEQEFNNMLESIEEYGGFYIGRYETGDLNKDKSVVQKLNNNIYGTTWYTMYKKCKELKNTNKNIETGMIWGSQFDRTLMWLIESENKTREEICKDSTNWGNYKNATFEFINNKGNIETKQKGSVRQIPTGSAEYTKTNNIYDLAGNAWDWTMEAYRHSFRELKGGHCYVDGSDSYSSKYLNYLPINGGVGCRAMLYIK